ncbi:MAG: DUF502 domain-containing protein [Alphaproteobacteria bacterium]|jgi:uncharacterized membrane protein|nr:DUF502 domain-containing protein [Alphaproteobacteria bacterium]|tara:strand:- start:198 stop:818 length:621 start_codon:yes stop_codon:yes gene_type:complete
MMQKIKSNLLAGIATIVPLALTVYVLQVTIELTIWIGGTVAEPLERFVNVTFPGFGLLSSLVGLLIVFLALFIFGGLARNVFGKRVVKWVEDIFKKIPLVDSIYGTTKQLIETISGSNNDSFKKVVYIEYPRKGMWTLGFVTSESTNQANEEFYHLFVPTTPNPTSGFFLIIAKEDTTPADIDVEEAFRMIVSSGIVGNHKNSIVK